MRIQIYEPAKQKHLTEPVRLRLVDTDQAIRVQCVNEKGENVPGGRLLDIFKDGSGIRRISYVSRDLGFKLTNNRTPDAIMDLTDK